MKKYIALLLTLALLMSLTACGGSAEGVEYPDFMEQLSPEMQAQWAEMEQELTDPEMMEMFEGMEGME